MDFLRQDHTRSPPVKKKNKRDREKDMDNQGFEKDNGDTNNVEVPMDTFKAANGDLKVSQTKH